MKVAVYTANFGEHEIFAPVVTDKRVDYIYFTDNSFRYDVWQIQNVARKFDDARLESRYYFDNSTLVLPDYDITVMHGANAQLLVSPLELIDKFLPDEYDIAAFEHPHRHCLYDEAQACKVFGKDKAGVIDTQIKRYSEELFPRNFGLHACGLIIRRNTQQIKDFERWWWYEVKNGSYRDQLSFDYVRWKTGIKVAIIPGDIFANPYLRVNQHER